MDARSHNLLEPCWNDGKQGNVTLHHYNVLMLENGNQYRVEFTREVTASGIICNVVATVPEASTADVIELDAVIDDLNILPKDGYECETLGWSYLGNIDSNPAVQTAINAAAAKGRSFRSILYNSGYFVFACPEERQFYDKG